MQSLLLCRNSMQKKTKAKRTKVVTATMQMQTLMLIQMLTGQNEM